MLMLIIMFSSILFIFPSHDLHQAGNVTYSVNNRHNWVHFTCTPDSYTQMCDFLVWDTSSWSKYCKSYWYSGILSDNREQYVVQTPLFRKLKKKALTVNTTCKYNFTCEILHYLSLVPTYQPTKHHILKDRNLP